MSSLTTTFLIIGMIVVTWGVRAAPFIVSNLTISPKLLKFLNCIPAAALAALVSEAILTPVVLSHSLLEPELVASSICLILGLLRAPMLVTVIVGMASFWLVRLIG